MALRFEDGRAFAQGACSYLYGPLTDRETANRILVNLRIGDFPTLAAVDTGAVHLICDPGIAEVLELDPSCGLDRDEVTIRGYTYPGTLHRVSVTLLADEGRSLEFESTAFVPELELYGKWPWHSFLGLQNCLERVRFAIDPLTDTFYFGSIDDN